MTKILVGIDEVGRGPVAGPVVICAAFIKEDYYKNFIKKISGIKDSKKMSEKKRKESVRLFREWQKEGWFDFVIKNKTASAIDRLGISACLRKCIQEALKEFDPKNAKIYLDGSLKAPQEFLDQETIIKGDEKEPLIAVASIIAKVFRDSYMEKINDSKYGFEGHKGYGTKAHLEAIKKYGLSKYHRKSFLRKYQ